MVGYSETAGSRIIERSVLVSRLHFNWTENAHLADVPGCRRPAKSHCEKFTKDGGGVVVGSGDARMNALLLMLILAAGQLYPARGRAGLAT
jgi:hypothetical protein